MRDDEREGEDETGHARETAPLRVPHHAIAEDDGGFWVFGYGSLMWRPGFAYAERRAATLTGYARRFCLWSVRYRGTETAPGLVLGLAEDDAASTRGVAYRVAPDCAEEARDYLAERELVTAAYRETTADLVLLDGPEQGARRRALTYVVDPAHKQYAGGLSLERQAEIIASSVGPMGPNCEYLFNTVAHLRAEGLDAAALGELHSLEELVLGAMAVYGFAPREDER